MADEKLAANLRGARQRRQLSQQAVAAAMHMSRTTIVAIESASREVADAELSRFATLYETTVELLRGSANFDYDRPDSPNAIMMFWSPELSQVVNALAHNLRRNTIFPVPGLIKNDGSVNTSGVIEAVLFKMAQDMPVQPLSAPQWQRYLDIYLRLRSSKGKKNVFLNNESVQSVKVIGQALTAAGDWKGVYVTHGGEYNKKLAIVVAIYYVNDMFPA